MKGVQLMIKYKVVEISVVTDDTIEEALNTWTSRGWQFDSLQFAMREASKRPAMVFVLFVRDDGPGSKAG
jgi:NAD(P)H-flavin reductase